MFSTRLVVLVVLASSCFVPAQAGKGLFDADTFRTFSVRFGSASWYQELVNNKRIERYIKADFTANGKTLKDVGVRGRGGQTWGAGLRTGKLPLKISFDAFVPGQRFMGRRSLTLAVGYEPSFMKEVLAFRVMRKYIPAPEANFVKVVMQGQAWGVYLNIETPNKDFLETWYDADNGNRYKGFGLANRGPNPNSYRIQRLMSSPRPDSYKDLAAALSRMSLQGPAHEREVPKGIDVDAMHRYFACNAILTVSDSFPGHNFYIYVDPYHDQLSIIPWDVNYSWRGTVLRRTTPLWHGGVSSNVWTLRYQAHLRTILEEMDTNEVVRWINAYHKLVLADMKKETKWFFSTANIVNEVARIVVTMNNFRAASLRLLGRTPIRFSAHTRTPHAPSSKDTVWITVKTQSTQTVTRMLLHSRVRGYFKEVPMFDDGKHRDGKANDGVFGISLPPALRKNFDYYFSAEVAGAVAFHPSAAAHKPYRFSSFTINRNKVLIHEVLASNVTGIKDPKGEREDWIELFNPTPKTISVGGMFLSDDIDKIKKWKLPSGLALSPGGRLLIWADDETGEGPLHAGFKLSAGGDQVYLTDKDGVTLLDYIEFEDQADDVSIGRLFDRISPFVKLDQPSPLASNELRFCGHRTFAPFGAVTRPLGLEFQGTPRINTKVSFHLDGASNNGSYLLMIGLRPAALPTPLPGLMLHLGAPILTSLAIPAGPKGTATIPATILNDPQLDGFHLSFQALSIVDKVVVGSNGLEMRFCK